MKRVYALGKSYIASFAPIAFDALSQGDEAAQQVLKKCSLEFEKLLWAVYRAWGEKTCEITLFGSVSKRFDVIKQFLSEEIQNSITFKMPQYPIIYGLMKDFIGDKDFAENFSRAYIKGNKQKQ